MSTSISTGDPKIASFGEKPIVGILCACCYYDHGNDANRRRPSYLIWFASLPCSQFPFALWLGFSVSRCFKKNLASEVRPQDSRIIFHYPDCQSPISALTFSSTFLMSDCSASSSCCSCPVNMAVSAFQSITGTAATMFVGAGVMGASVC